MPVMDGVEFLSIVKSDPKLRHIEVVMLSGLESERLAKACLDAGAMAVLIKPIDTDEVQKVIESMDIGIG